jgi:catechol 2,3-dioxygenase-like lactoylglutathione lyase family enzyme
VDTHKFEIGVIEMFYPDLAAAKAFYQDVLGLTVDRKDGHVGVVRRRPHIRHPADIGTF